MAINRKGQTSGTGLSAGSDQVIIIPVPPGATTGNYLVAFIAFQATWSATTGYSGTHAFPRFSNDWEVLIDFATDDAAEHYDNANPGLSLLVVGKFLLANETQFTAHVLAAPDRIGPVHYGIAAYGGVDQTTPIDVDGDFDVTTPAATTSVAPSLTLPTASSKLICFFVVPQDANLGITDIPGVPTGMTSVIGLSHNPVASESAGGVRMADQTIGSSGATGTRTSALPASTVESLAATVALRRDQSNPSAELTAITTKLKWGLPKINQPYIPGDFDKLILAPNDSLIRIIAKAEPYEFASATTVPLWFTNIGFRSKKTDDPVLTHMRGVLEADEFSVSRSIFGENAIGGAASISLGSIILRNNDGLLDRLFNYAWDWRLITLYAGGMRRTKGRRSISLDDYMRIGVVRTQAPDGDIHEVTIPLEDGGSIFQRNAQEFRYDGTGGMGGDPEIAGSSIPIGLGLVLNARPQCVDKFNLIFQFHDGEHYGAARELIAVYDQGILIPATFYTVDLAAGTFTYLRNPAGAGSLTCDFRGPEDAGDTPATFVKWLASTVGCGPLTYPNNFNTGYYFTFQEAASYQIGLYLPSGDNMTIYDALNLAVAPLGFWAWSRDGKFIVGLVEPPTGTADLDFVKSEILQYEKVRAPIPVSQYIIGYGRNWTLQGQSDLAGTAVNSERGAFAQLEWRQSVYPATPDPDVLAAYPSAKAKQSTDQEIEFIPTLIVYKEDADRITAAGFDLYGRAWDLARVTVPLKAWRTDLAKVVSVSFDRYSIGSNKLYRVLEMDETRRSITLLLWAFRSVTVLTTEDGDTLITEDGSPFEIT